MLNAILTLTVIAAQPQSDSPGTLSTVERNRGGRHWIDAPTDPPKTPAESLKAFEIEPGFRITLVASEPLVMDPVAVAFDVQGRMFVAEYGDYPNGPEQEGAPPLSRVVLLSDGDGDGTMDTRQVFADRLQYVHSLMPLHDGILIGAQTQIVFLKDTDGDNRADVREIWFDGFVPAHPQMQIGNPRWELDNWISLNYGPGTITAHKPTTREPVTMPRRDFRFHPLTFEFGSDSGLGQFGNTVDNYGHRFFTTNRNPIMVSMLPQSVVTRNPFAVIPKAYTDVGPSGGDTRVYPLVAMKSNYLSHAGTHTSACGVTAYRGDLFDSGMDRSSVFVCEPVGHLVTRSIVRPDGTGLTADRARDKADFLASRDTWFRPASLANGPDGALYLADMYRLWVEHPKFLPPEIAERIDWRAGEDRGRIWRIVPDNAQRRTFQPPNTTDDLVDLLRDTNGWRRTLGQRLLVERQVHDAVPALKRLLTDSSVSGITRLHALWTLDGLGSLGAGDVKKALRDSDAWVQRDAVKLSGRLLQDNERLLTQVASLADGKHAHVRFQVALTLGDVQSPQATDALTLLAVISGTDRWMSAALMTAARERSGAILRGLVSNQHVRANPDFADLITQLAASVGARGDEAELAGLLDTIAATTNNVEAAWWQTAGLTGLASGLPRHRGKLGRTSLTKLLSDPPDMLADSVPPVRSLIEHCRPVATDATRDPADRVAAIQLLSYQPFDQASETLSGLLNNRQPVSVQRACIDALRKIGTEPAANMVLDRWSDMGPTVRGPALALLLSRTNTTKLALNAMSDGVIPSATIDLDMRIRLLKHRDEQIRKLATGLFGGAVSADRVAVATQYEPALTMKASALEGRKVFRRVCAKCHRIDGEGFQVGPDISDVRNRARDALLYDILDPNRKVEPKFLDYTVVTDDGRLVNGLLVTETADAVVLKLPEDKQQVIPRSQIDEFSVGRKSLMPEGVEKEVSVRQMADLLEYLKTRDVRADGQPSSAP